MKQITDLHTHSTASDGQYTPSELVRLARDRGIEALALTDHDTLDGLEVLGVPRRWRTCAARGGRAVRSGNTA